MGRTTGPASHSGEVLREELLKKASVTSPGIISVVAPSGYGKSVLARQIASLDRFKASWWVDLASSRQGLSGIIGSVLSEVRNKQADPSSPACRLRPAPEYREMLAELSEALQCYRGAAVCVVLDDIAFDDATDELLGLGACLDCATCDASCLVFTCRGLGERAHALLADSWTVEPQDLVLSAREIAAYVRPLLGVDPSESVVEALQKASGGQAAILSVLARHLGEVDADALPTGRVPLDISHRLRRLAIQSLSPSQRRSLCAGALLGTGRVDELDVVLGAGSSRDLSAIAEAVPLVHLDHGGPGGQFRFHEYAQRAFSETSFVEAETGGGNQLLERICRQLVGRGASARAMSLAMEYGSETLLVELIGKVGRDLLRRGYTEVVERALSHVTRASQVESPQTVLLEADLLREKGLLTQAEARALIARQLAEHSCESETVFESCLLLARLYIDAGRYLPARASLERVIALADHEPRPLNLGLVHAYLVICCAYLGDLDGARHHDELAREVGLRDDAEDYSRAYILHAGTIISGLLEGYWNLALARIRELAADDKVPVSLRLIARNNEACALALMGRVECAQLAIDDVVQQSHSLGLDATHVASVGCRVLLLAARRAYESAESEVSSLSSVQDIDTTSAAQDFAFQSQWLRAAGEQEAALLSAETSRRLACRSHETTIIGGIAEVEVAACHLAAGDDFKAAWLAEQARRSYIDPRARYQSLLADLVLAEAARRQGRDKEAVARLLEHADYIQTESANLTIAFYVRAFPGLLGVLSQAVGPDRLPAHMLRLLDSKESEEALRVAWPEMERAEWDALAARLLDEDAIQALAESLQGVAPCRVRLFGGLEIVTPDGVIPDRAWRKRKARLLFAMLVAKQGRDVPREQILEHLWPDMNEEKARNNYYVVWNNLKTALSPQLPKGENCPYVESVGGLCRVSAGLVRSDLDEFEELLTRARDEEASGDAEAAIATYRRLEEVYRGDLLPGDVYDDWFGPLRERCRQQFGDAMVAAARLNDEFGQCDVTLHVLRRGLDHDPLREDLYQEMLRAQIDAGQRSAAIETYMACRERLAEDLGLDPSVETRLLYDRVLAMEDSPPSASSPTVSTE